MRLYTELGVRDRLGDVLWDMSTTYLALGDRASAISTADAAAKIKESLGDREAEEIRDRIAEWQQPVG